jgi:hypothetical protein
MIRNDRLRRCLALGAINDFYGPVTSKEVSLFPAEKKKQIPRHKLLGMTIRSKLREPRVLCGE